MNDASLSRDSIVDELQRLRKRVVELEAQLAGGAAITTAPDPNGRDDDRAPDPGVSHADVARLGSDERFRTLAENVPGVIYLCRNDERYSMLYLNDAVEALTGYPKQDFLTDRISFVELYHPDDADWIPSAVDQALRQRQPFQLTYRLRDRAGRWRWVSEIGVGVFEGDELVMLEGFVQDVTARHEAEQALRDNEARLRLTIEQLPAVLWSTDSDLRFTSSLGAGLGDLGLKPNEVVGMSLFEFFQTQDPQFPTIVAHRRAMAGESVAYEQVWQNNIYQTHVEPMRDAHGQIMGCLGVAYDISERSRHEQALRDAHDQLEKRVAERTQDLSVANRQLQREVVERSAVEHALRSSEERFRKLVHNASDVITVLDTEGRILYESPSIERVGGQTAQEVLGENAFDYVHPEDLPAVTAALDRCVREPGANVSVDFRWRHADGSWVYIESIGYSLLDDPAVKGIVVNSRDISDRKRSETALRESEMRLRAVLDTTPVLILLLDRDGRYRDIFTGSYELLAAPREQLLGRTIHEMLSSETARSIQDVIDRTLQSGTLQQFEYPMQFGDQQRWFAARVVPFETDGDRCVLWVALEITSRVEMEKALRLVQTAVEQVHDGVIITEPQLDLPGPRILYCNPAFEAMTGFSAEELLGSTPRILQGPQTNREVLQRLRRELLESKPFQAEAVNYRKDGSPYTVEWVIAPVRDEQGTLINWVSIQRDVTEQRRMEALMRQRQSELAHVARLSTMGEMASGLAHELNQPLTALLNYGRGALRMLGEDRLDVANSRLVLEHIVGQADRAAGIIQRMRNFAKKRDMRRTEADVNQLIREVIDFSVFDVRQAETRLVLDLAQDLPKVVVDPVLIEQVILNLVRNGLDAMEHTPAGQRELALRSRREDDAVIVEVSDSGPGLASEARSRMFDPFYTTKSKGMGMGLTISQSIVTQHGGRLWAAPDSEQGATFLLKLPRFESHTSSA